MADSPLEGMTKAQLTAVVTKGRREAQTLRRRLQVQKDETKELRGQVSSMGALNSLPSDDARLLVSVAEQAIEDPVGAGQRLRDYADRLAPEPPSATIDDEIEDIEDDLEGDDPMSDVIPSPTAAPVGFGDPLTASEREALEMFRNKLAAEEQASQITKIKALAVEEYKAGQRAERRDANIIALKEWGFEDQTPEGQRAMATALALSENEDFSATEAMRVAAEKYKVSSVLERLGDKKPVADVGGGNADAPKDDGILGISAAKLGSLAAPPSAAPANGAAGSPQGDAKPMGLDSSGFLESVQAGLAAIKVDAASLG